MSATDMSDEELLKLAAKAAGLYYPDVRKYFNWNPLTNNSDALQLAIDLGLTIIQDTKYRVCAVHWTDVAGCRAAYGKDKTTATRRAIVRAAASIAINSDKE